MPETIKFWSNSSCLPKCLYRAFEKKEYAVDFIKGNFRFNQNNSNHRADGHRKDSQEDLYRDKSGGVTSISPRFTLCFSGEDVDLSHMQRNLGKNIVVLDEVEAFVEGLRKQLRKVISIKCHDGGLVVNGQSMQLKNVANPTGRELAIDPRDRNFSCHLFVLAVEFSVVHYGQYFGNEDPSTNATNCYLLKDKKYSSDKEWRAVLHLDRAKTKYECGSIDNLERLFPLISHIPVSLDVNDFGIQELQGLL